MLDRIEFILSEAFVALRRNSWMTFSAVTTSAVALYLLGGLALTYISLTTYAAALPGRLGMDVLLRDGTTKESISEVAGRIRALPGVDAAVWVSKEEFWRQQRAKLPKEVTEGVDNPLPDKFRVTLTDVSVADRVAEAIRAIPAVAADGVVYLAQEQRIIGDALRLLRMLGLLVGGLMLVTSGVLIYNAIRLTVRTRSREIRIMAMVGASRGTIVTPLLIEGVLQGALGGTLAGMLLWSSHAALARLLEGLVVMGSLGDFPVAPTTLALASVGAAYGLLCSFFATFEAK